MSTPFPRDAHLTTITRAYKNPDVVLIADDVLPRVEVGKRTFRHYQYPLEQGFSIPNTHVGERGQVREVELKGTQVEKTCEDFGIQIPLSASDIEDAPKGVDPRERATEQATNYVVLDRERRVANMMFDAANWPLITNLASGGKEQWDASSPTKNPLEVIITQLGTCAMRPNVIVFGAAVWAKLRFHPKVIEAALGTAGGVVTRERVAEILELQQVLVGAALINSAKPGKPATLASAWGKHALAFYRDRTADTSGGLTTGYTAQYGQRIAGAKDVDMGLRGGTVVRAGEIVREVIVADRAAHFFQNAIA